MWVMGFVDFFNEKNGWIVVCLWEKGYICNYCAADVWRDDAERNILG
jgi:hypothetical protein